MEEAYQSAIAATQAGIFQPRSKVVLRCKDQRPNLKQLLPVFNDILTALSVTPTDHPLTTPVMQTDLEQTNTFLTGLIFIFILSYSYCLASIMCTTNISIKQNKTILCEHCGKELTVLYCYSDVSSNRVLMEFKGCNLISSSVQISAIEVLSRCTILIDIILT